MSNAHDPTERLLTPVFFGGCELPRGLAEIFTPQRKADLIEAVKSGDAEIDLSYYADLTEWIMHLLLVGVRHAVPEATNDDAIKIARFVAQRLYLPGSKNLWKIASNWIDRRGVTQAARRLIQELQRKTVKADKL